VRQPRGGKIPVGVESHLDAMDVGTARVQPVECTPLTTTAPDEHEPRTGALSEVGVIPVGDGDMTAVADRGGKNLNRSALRYRDRNDRALPLAGDRLLDLERPGGSSRARRHAQTHELGGHHNRNQHVLEGRHARLLHAREHAAPATPAQTLLS
jgi:hypothetical protein